MDKIKKNFLNIQKQFASKKPSILRKIGRWRKWGKTSLYKQAKLLFNEVQQCEKEIISVFKSSDWKYNRPFLKVKIKAFEGLFDELIAMTNSSWLRWVEAAIVVTITVFVLRTFVFGVYHVPTGSAETTLLVGDRVWGNKFTYFFNEPKKGDMVMFEDTLFEYDKKSLIQRLWQKYVGVEVEILGLKPGPTNMAKRIIACPGDVIEGRVIGGRTVIYRNGKKIKENYVNKNPLIAIKKETGFFTREKIGLFEIPEFLKFNKKVVLYSYDPKKDFEEQPFYFIDYQKVLYDRKKGKMKIYKSYRPSKNRKGKNIDVFGPYIVPEGKYWVMGDNRRNSIDSREWGFIGKEKISGKASFVIWSLDSEEPIWLFEFFKNPFRFFSLLRVGRFFKGIE